LAANEEKKSLAIVEDSDGFYNGRNIDEMRTF
jgi:hypothetical protein